MTKNFVIVGGGQAAAQAIQTLQQNKYEGSITLVGEEIYPPYQRPPLSKKYMAGELQRERLFLRPLKFYESNNIDLELGTRAIELDVGNSHVRLNNDRLLKFDGLMLATGSKVRRLKVPGSDLDGIHYVRTLADVDEILPKLKTAKRLVIIGAGYIGLEVAAVSISSGLDVTVLEATNRVMTRTVSTEVSNFYSRYHSKAGVNLKYLTTVSHFEGNKKVTAVETADGQKLACDLVVVGIGIEPEVELAETAGLPCKDGIIVDEFACTEGQNIFAAGDCTNHPNQLLSKRIRLESVQNAIDQAKAGIQTFLGEKTPYKTVPWFWSDQYDLKLQIAGLSEGYDQILVRGDPKKAPFAVFYIRAGRVVTVEAVNLPQAFMIGKRLISTGIQVERKKLVDFDFDLKDLIKL